MKKYKHYNATPKPMRTLKYAIEILKIIGFEVTLLEIGRMMISRGEYSEQLLHQELVLLACNTPITDEKPKHLQELLRTIMLSDSFSVNYDTKVLMVSLNGEMYKFDLTKGDEGDYWYGFELVDGTIKDVNFTQETHEETPSVCVYGVKDGQIDMSDEILITDHVAYGDTKNYFPWPTETEEQERIDKINEK